MDRRYVTLNNGVEMPRLGFGTARLVKDRAFAGATATLKAGYRRINTASVYGNEHEVGMAIRECGARRDEVFVTTKLPRPAHDYDLALKVFDASVSRLRLDRVDLYLIPWPVPILDR